VLLVSKHVASKYTRADLEPTPTQTWPRKIASTCHLLHFPSFFRAKWCAGEILAICWIDSEHAMNAILRQCTNADARNVKTHHANVSWLLLCAQVWHIKHDSGMIASIRQFCWE
jgi:hypothetical protein